MDSYRVEKQAAIKIALPDADSEIGPVPTDGGGRKPEPEMDYLSNIIKTFNDQFGNIDWKDGDKIRKVIAEEIPAKVSRIKPLSERNEALRQTKCSHRARQGLAAGHHRIADGSYRAIQTVQRQSIVQEVAWRSIFAATYQTQAEGTHSE